MRLTDVSSGGRWPWVDALRGAAMVWMTAFHFCFDLSHLGVWKQNFLTDPLWTVQRSCIVSLFLLCAGWGQALAVAQGQGWVRFGRRWLQVALCAALVSVASWVMFPDSFIYFGVLHGLAMMLLLVRLLALRARHSRLALVAIAALGALLVAAPWIAQATLSGALADALNQRSLNWLGLITRKPFTEDYVPLMPWLGVMLWGYAAGMACLRRVRRGAAGSSAVLPRCLQPLGWLGRWSLSYYMLHQVVLLGGLTAGLWLVR